MPAGDRRQQLPEAGALSSPSPTTTTVGLDARENGEGHSKSDDADPSRPALHQRDEQNEGNDKSEDGRPALPRYGHATDAIALLDEPGFSRPHRHGRMLASRAGDGNAYLPGAWTLSRGPWS